MDGFWAFLLMTFCTPLGWVGMYVFGVVIKMIKEGESLDE